MRIFKSKHFDRWARRQDLRDDALRKAVDEIENGLVDTKLGGNLYKKRIATRGRGKRGSTRTIIAFKKSHRIFFIYGFEKGERTNITEKEQQALKIYGKTLLNWPDREILKRIDEGELFEIEEVN
ncbi:MAG: type II toxin-antitoxin system RelE/ParE family toxin [Nitrospiria bacterium]